jgi:hypothetical protein
MGSYYAANREAAAARRNAYRLAHPEAELASHARWRRAVRKSVFDHYGWTCACCGSADGPAIDHVNGDGGEHRAQIGIVGGGASERVYRWLIANGFPAGFQTLCRPCNSSKQNGPACRLEHDVKPYSLSGVA